MKCPYYGHKRFYFKDTEDEFETFAFDCSSGEICFDPVPPEDAVPELSDKPRFTAISAPGKARFRTSGSHDAATAHIFNVFRGT